MLRIRSGGPAGRRCGMDKEGKTQHGGVSKGQCMSYIFAHEIIDVEIPNGRNLACCHVLHLRIFVLSVLNYYFSFILEDNANTFFSSYHSLATRGAIQGTIGSQALGGQSMYMHMRRERERERIWALAGVAAFCYRY